MKRQESLEAIKLGGLGRREAGKQSGMDSILKRYFWTGFTRLTGYFLFRVNSLMELTLYNPPDGGKQLLQ
jgi:hypothetical protein